jgi:glycolate oxidase FAD binding subunit
MARRARRPIADGHVSTAAVVSAIKESGSTRSPLRIAGRSTWLGAGRPVRADKTLSLRDDSGVVSYVPGDLTLTVRAGTSLSEIERVTREHDQWLPLDPYGSNDGTIGATIATASAGPLASSFGLPRDLLLGLEFVNGRGEVVRGGGKVVKNVAGFDLSRLLTGSWGTLGVITEVTVRLYARPQADRSFVIRLAANEKESNAFLRPFLAASFSPYALELLSASAAFALGLGERAVCLMRFGGNTAAVDAQLNAVSRIAGVEEVETSVWEALRTLERGSGCVIRVTGLPGEFRSVSASMLTEQPSGILNYIDPARGVLRLVVRAPNEHEESKESVFGISTDMPPNERVVYETLPADVWSEVSPSVVADPLSRGIRKAYDPHDILNPGILGD